MASAGADAVIWGITKAGRAFRPSDWADRLAGLTSAFGRDRTVTYSPHVSPVMVQGVRAIIVGHELEALEPRLWQFLLQFARDNDLEVSRVAHAMESAHALVPPRPPASGEPREPV
jgi:Protein of unknown function (DUF3579)